MDDLSDMDKCSTTLRTLKRTSAQLRVAQLIAVVESGEATTPSYLLAKATLGGDYASTTSIANSG